MKALLFVASAVWCVHTTCGLPPLGFPGAADVAKSLFDVTSGVVRKLPDTLPSVDAIFATSKNLVAGYPIEAIVSAINHFCECPNI